MTAKDLSDVVAGIAPVIREYSAGLVKEWKAERDSLLEVIVGLEQRVAVAEQRAMTPGPVGPPGGRGDSGATGERGETGLTGEKGDIGPAGERGDLGPMGLTGPKGLDGQDGAPGLNGKDGADGLHGTPGADGQKGVDGATGRDGRDGIQGVPGTHGLDGKDGAAGLNGKDGADGLGFDDLDAVYDEQGRMSLRFSRGDQVKTFRVPGHVYCDVYRAEKAYEPGDGVTFGGSLWIAKLPTQGVQPDTNLGASAWRLAVKRGDRGRTGENGIKGIDGQDGRPGRDLTSFDPATGNKW